MARPCLVLADAPEAPGETLLLWNVNRGSRAGSRAARPFPAGPFAWDAAHDHGETAFEVYNLLQAGPGGLRMESDRLGLKAVYWAEDDDGFLLANKLLDLLSVRPTLAHPVDPVALQETLIAGYAMAGRTLHARIRRTPAGAVLRWMPGGALAVAAGRRLEVPPPRIGWSLDDAATEIAAVLEAAVARRAAGQDPIHVSLTGGFDSRVLLAAAQAQGLRCRAVTYGNPLHHETAVTRRVARLAGVPLAVASYPRAAVLDGLAINLAEAEATSDLVFGVLNLLHAGLPAGSFVASGFIGGMLGGATLGAFTKGRSLRDRDDVRAAVLNRQGLAPPRPVLPYVAADPAAAAILGDIEGLVASGPEPYQALRLFDIEMRQRHLTENHFRFLGTELDMSAPYADPRLMELYLALPRTMLDGRQITRHLLRHVYPRFAGIRHAEELMPVIPRGRDHLRAMLDALAPRTPGFLRSPPVPARGMSLRTALRLSSIRHIWQVSMYQLMRDRGVLLDRMEATFPAYRRLFGARVERFDPAPLRALPPRPFGQLLMVFEYAAAVDKAMAPAA